MSKEYKQLKNFIHNEAGITKEELREMIREVVQVEVKQIVEAKRPYIEETVEVYTREHINSIIKHGLSDGGRLLYGFKERVSSTLSDAVGKYVASQLNIEVQVKEPRNEGVK